MRGHSRCGGHDGAVSGVQTLRGVPEDRVGWDAGVSGRGVHLSRGTVRAAFRHGADEPSDADAATHDAYGIFRHAAPVRLGRKDHPPPFPQGNGVRGLDPSLRYPFRGFSRLANRDL